MSSVITELGSRWTCRACPASSGCRKTSWDELQVSEVTAKGRTSWWPAGAAYMLDNTYVTSHIEFDCLQSVKVSQMYLSLTIYSVSKKKSHPRDVTFFHFFKNGW